MRLCAIAAIKSTSSQHHALKSSRFHSDESEMEWEIARDPRQAMRLHLICDDGDVCALNGINVAYTKRTRRQQHMYTSRMLGGCAWCAGNCCVENSYILAFGFSNCSCKTQKYNCVWTVHNWVQQIIEFVVGETIELNRLWFEGTFVILWCNFTITFGEVSQNYYIKHFLCIN